jgi:uncharacterized glyoxalase superfamily protein PhnB
MPDPLEQLHSPAEPARPRDLFRRDLRRRIVDALGVDPTDITIELPRRSATMETTTNSPTSDQSAAGDGARATLDGIWPVVVYDDPHAAIRFMVDVLGFEERIVVIDPSDPSVIVHSELRWPEGGIVQVAGRSSDNPHTREISGSSMYVITRDPDAVLARCDAAGAEVVVPMREVDYDVPGSKGFSVRDAGGIVWSFGHYGMVR